jgi:RNA polymerase sigma-70 factor (ECF subfamily)
MAEAEDEFSGLMRRLRDGDEEAARVLLRDYGPHILRIIRRRLDPKLRSKFDSQDFAQSVWASFFAGLPEQDLNFDRPEALLAFLKNLASNKVIDAHRQRRRTKKYDVAREHSLDGSAAAAAGHLAVPGPTPSQAAVAKERWDRLLEGQPDYCQRILVMLQKGYTHQEIADQLGLNEKTVRRLLRRLAPESK